MSQLGDLKNQINALADETTRMAGNLSAFRSQFSNTSTRVQATIGGSSQGKDRALMDAVTQAQRQVEAAATAMQHAAAVARNYGSSL